MLKIYIGADHNGFETKESLKKYFETKGFSYEDLGNIIHDQTDDYPDYAHKVAEAVATNNDSTGILICGSSHGVCITANKTKGIRAGEVSNEKDAQFARKDTDCNIMCLSGWKLKDTEHAKNIVNVWLNTQASQEERHQRRINKIKKIEDNVFK